MRRRDFIAFVGGVAACWPLAAAAQQPNMPVVGFLSARSPEDSTDLIEAFRGGLKEDGFVEGQDAAIEFRWARGNYSRLPALAGELVSRRVAVISAVGSETSAKAAEAATSTIPIVFAVGTQGSARCSLRPIPISTPGAIESSHSRRGSDCLPSTSFANSPLPAEC
jgi:putative tryptophan/tyrosine transport system substrate-binding protein